MACFPLEGMPNDVRLTEQANPTIILKGTLRKLGLEEQTEAAVTQTVEEILTSGRYSE